MSAPGLSVPLPPAGAYGAEVMARLDALARHSDDPDNLTRGYLTAAHKGAIDLLRGWMEAAGMSAGLDPLATLIGRYEGARPGAPALLIGSHIDTVPDGGRYDGAFGVVAAIACVDWLNRQGLRLPFAVEVLAFGDEEGARFPGSLRGSRALAGILEADALDARDAAGVSVREALAAFGIPPGGAAARRAEDVVAYLELHIEQGPVLDREGLPVGVVTAINAASRFLFHFTGEAGHAGTVPMRLRRDALAAAAETALAVERIAAAVEDVVGTVGRIAVAPGAGNVIPGAATISLDLRAPDPGLRDRACDQVFEAARAAAERRGVALAIETVEKDDGCAMAPWLMDAFADAIAALGLPVRRLPSGAGHDAMALAALTDVGMLFLRCKDGISHNPREEIAADDADVAVRVALGAIGRIAARYERGGKGPKGP